MGFDQPIILHDFFPPAKASMPGKNNVCTVQESSGVSLALTLSCNHHLSMSMSSSVTDDTISTGFKKSCQVLKKENHKTEMKRLGFSLELTLGGAYTRSMEKVAGKRPVVEEANNNKRKPKLMKGINSLELTLGFNKPNCTTYPPKKRERRTMEIIDSCGCSTSGSSVNSSACITNKKRKVNKEEMIMIRNVNNNVDNGANDNPWLIRKRLVKSDIDGLSRLLLQRHLVNSYVYPFWNDDQLARINEGLPVMVWDCDTHTRHELVYQYWSSSGANVLRGNWIQDFVKRRDLKVDDEIGLYWDQDSSEFKFSLLNPVPRNQHCLP